MIQFDEHIFQMGGKTTNMIVAFMNKQMFNLVPDFELKLRNLGNSFSQRLFQHTPISHTQSAIPRSPIMKEIPL